MGEHGGHRVRVLWPAVEPVHAVTYFVPEPLAACDALGTRGYWMSYFAQRAVPPGAAPPEVVTGAAEAAGMTTRWIRPGAGRDVAGRRGVGRCRGRLTARGLVEDGVLTEAGLRTRAEVEAPTDSLPDVQWVAVGDERARRLVELVAPLVRAIVAGAGFPPTNAMGLRPLPSPG